MRQDTNFIEFSSKLYKNARGPSATLFFEENKFLDGGEREQNN